MKISMICFSLTGFETGIHLKEALTQLSFTVSLDKKSKYLPDSISESTMQWAGRQFEEADALIFIGACGIAVRSIAPYIVSKKKDPAVLVLDECGKFVISLLSGHLGGANELTQTVAEILGAQPVVTTATDLHKRFAVDVFAKKNQAEIHNMTAAKEISAALLAGKRVGFYSEFPWEGELPDGLILCDKNGKTTNGYELDETEKSVKDRTENSICESEKGDSKAENQAEKDETMDVRSKEVIPELGIAVTIHRGSQPFTSTVTIIPPVLSLGIGCKKGSEAGAVLAAAEQTLITNDFYREAFADLASIDLKKDEEGIKALAQAWKLPFTTYTADELQKVPGEFTPSAFVQNVTGVDNVCERSAVRAAGNGRLLQKKRGGNGVTTAVAAREWRIHFE